MKAFGDVPCLSPEGEPKPRTYSWMSLGGTVLAWTMVKAQWEFTRAWQEPKQIAS